MVPTEQSLEIKRDCISGCLFMSLKQSACLAYSRYLMLLSQPESHL